MLQEHNCSLLTSLHVPNLKYTAHSTKGDSSHTFHKITRSLQSLQIVYQYLTPRRTDVSSINAYWLRQRACAQK